MVKRVPVQNAGSKPPRYDKSKTSISKAIASKTIVSRTTDAVSKTTIHANGSKKAAHIPASAGQDDVTIIAFSLPEVALNESMDAYFRKCEEKLGFVPNVLKAYAFDMAKLEAFVAMYNDLMLAPSGLSKLPNVEMIAVAVSSHNKCYYCLAAHGAAVRQMADDPVLGELMAMKYRAARLSKRQRAMLDFAVKLTAETLGHRG